MCARLCEREREFRYGSQERKWEGDLRFERDNRKYET